MKKSKFIFTVLLTLVLVINTASPAYAAQPTYSNSDKAQILNKLGLYNGIDSSTFNPDLGSNVNRETAVKMALELVGLKSKVASISDKDANSILANFKDKQHIDPSAIKSVAYVVINQIIATGSNGYLYPKGTVSGKEYYTMIMRLLGYNLDLDNAPAGWSPKGDLTEIEVAKFTSKPMIADDMAGISYYSLFTVDTDGNMVIENLINKNIVDSKIAQEVGIISPLAPFNIKSISPVTSNEIKINLNYPSIMQNNMASLVKISELNGKELKVLKTEFFQQEATNQTVIITLDEDMKSKSIYKLKIGTKFINFTTKSKKDDIFINSFYAINSFVDRNYAKLSDQVALGWSAIRKDKDNKIYFSQHRYTHGARETYGVPASSSGEADISNLVKDMKSKGAKLKLSVFLDNTELFRELLLSDETQDRVIGEMTKDFGIKYFDYNSKNELGEFNSSYVLDDNNIPIEYDGLVIDFEGLYNEYNANPGVQFRDKFNNFLSKLKEKLPDGKTLTICIPPKRELPVDYYTGYDYDYIGRIADEVILMAHDYQYNGQSKSQSILASAPYDMVEKSIQYAIADENKDGLQDIPSEKLLLAISINNMQWRTENGVYKSYAVSYPSMINALEGKNSDKIVVSVTPPESRYDEILKVGYSYLKRQSGSEYIEDEFYFENKRSIEEKIDLIKKYGLKGVSIWRLGIAQSDNGNQNYSSEIFDPIFKYKMFDLNEDGILNVFDFDIANSLLESKPVDANWNGNLDYNNNKQIDKDDVLRLKKYIE